MKLATELSKRGTGRTLYILDEPTTGLHIADVDRLVKILHQLVEGGNAVVVIEHTLDVDRRQADQIIKTWGRKAEIKAAPSLPQERQSR